MAKLKAVSETSKRGAIKRIRLNCARIDHLTRIAYMKDPSHQIDREPREAKPTTRPCVRCGDALAEGVRFCVACGTTNMDTGAGALAEADCRINSHNRKGFYSSLAYWCRLLNGIRR